MSALEILAVIGIIGYVIYRQVRGEPLRGKRAVLLPAILTVIGVTDLHGNGGAHLQPADVACLVAGAAGSALIGLAFGAITHLESRDGHLWARLPLWGLWLWAALAAWRVGTIVAAHALHAQIAASSATLLFSLGVNRLAQAAVIVPRAMAAGIPFAPEKDGRVFMAERFERSRPARPADFPTRQDDPFAPYDLAAHSARRAGRDDWDDWDDWDDRRRDRRERHDRDRYERRARRRGGSYDRW